MCGCVCITFSRHDIKFWDWEKMRASIVENFASMFGLFLFCYCMRSLVNIKWGRINIKCHRPWPVFRFLVKLHTFSLDLQYLYAYIPIFLFYSCQNTLVYVNTCAFVCTQIFNTLDCQFTIGCFNSAILKTQQKT